MFVTINVTTLLITEYKWVILTVSADTYFAKTLDNGLRILNLFDHDTTRLSLAQITRQLEMNKTTAYRLVNTLVVLGYLEKHPQTKTLRIGQQALTLGHRFSQSFELLQLTKPLIDKTYSRLKVTIDSALWNGSALLALYRREAPDTLSFRHPIISRALHARSMGKAVLAHLSPEELSLFLKENPLVSHTPNTIVQKSELTSQLETVRYRGYSINVEEYIIGIISLGAPLLDYSKKKVVGAISFDLLADKYKSTDWASQFAGDLTRLANELSNHITIANS